MREAFCQPQSLPGLQVRFRAGHKKFRVLQTDKEKVLCLCCVQMQCPANAVLSGLNQYLCRWNDIYADQVSEVKFWDNAAPIINYSTLSNSNALIWQGHGITLPNTWIWLWSVLGFTNDWLVIPSTNVFGMYHQPPTCAHIHVPSNSLIN